MKKFKVGDRISHKHYGVGEVVYYHGDYDSYILAFEDYDSGLSEGEMFDDAGDYEIPANGYDLFYGHFDHKEILEHCSYYGIKKEIELIEKQILELQEKKELLIKQLSK